MHKQRERDAGDDLHQEQRKQQRWRQQQPGLERLLKILKNMDASPSPLSIALFRLQQQEQDEQEELAWQSQQAPIDRLFSLLRLMDACTAPLTLTVHDISQQAAASTQRLRELVRVR